MTLFLYFNGVQHPSDQIGKPLAWIARALPKERGIKAFREEDSALNTPPTTYDLRLQIGEWLRR